MLNSLLLEWGSWYRDIARAGPTASFLNMSTSP